MTRSIQRAFAFAVVAIGVGAGASSAQEYEQCKFMSNEGRIANSYELVGAEACEAFCSETEGCGFWFYTPHNFNPDTGPGQCQLYGAAADKEPDDRTYCGSVAQ